MRIVFFLLCCGWIGSITAQNIVVDKDTKKPIPFARYEYVDVRGYADLNGLINVNLKDADTLKVFALGYEDLVVSKIEALSQKTLFMTPGIEFLEQVDLIINRVPRILKAGKRTRLLRSIGISDNLIFFTKISNSNNSKTLKLNQIKIYFDNLKELSKTAEKEGLNFAIRLSVVDDNLQALHDEIIFSKGKKINNSWIFELTDYHIFLEEKPIYVGIESIGFLNEDGSFNNQEIFLSFKLSEKVFTEFNLDSFIFSKNSNGGILVPFETDFINAFKNGTIKSSTGSLPLGYYNLNPMMEFTVTEY